MVVKADITIDIDKQVGNLQNLTNIYNARVGDSNTPLTVLWQKNGIALNLKGLHAFIAGKVGDGSYNAETDEINFPVGSPVVKYEDDGSGTLDNGQSGLTTLLIPKQMWVKTGLFAGYIGLKDENGSVLTSKDIFFKVLGNVLDAGVEINYFIDDFDKALAKVKGDVQQAIDDARNTYESETKNAHDSFDALNSQIQANRDEQENLSQRLAGAEQQIQTNDVITKPEFYQLSNQLTQQVSQMRQSGLEFFNNADALKEAYPQGANKLCVTLDDSHQWIYDYSHGQWNDAGAFNYGTIDPKLQNGFYRKNTDNLIPNADFDTLDGWTVQTTNGTTPNLTIRQGTKEHGSNIARIIGYWDNEHPDSSSTWLQSPMFPIDSKKTLTYGAKVDFNSLIPTTGGTAQIQLKFFDADGKYTGFDYLSLLSSTNQKLTNRLREGILPPNAVQAQLFFFIRGGGYLDISMPVVNEGYLVADSIGELDKSLRKTSQNVLATKPVDQWLADDKISIYLSKNSDLLWNGYATTQLSSQSTPAQNSPCINSGRVRLAANTWYQVKVPAQVNVDYTNSNNSSILSVWQFDKNGTQYTQDFVLENSSQVCERTMYFQTIKNIDYAIFLVAINGSAIVNLGNNIEVQKHNFSSTLKLNAGDLICLDINHASKIDLTQTHNLKTDIVGDWTIVESSIVPIPEAAKMCSLKIRATADVGQNGSAVLTIREFAEKDGSSIANTDLHIKEDSSLFTNEFDNFPLNANTKYIQILVGAASQANISFENIEVNYSDTNADYDVLTGDPFYVWNTFTWDASKGANTPVDANSVTIDKVNLYNSHPIVSIKTQNRALNDYVGINSDVLNSANNTVLNYQIIYKGTGKLIFTIDQLDKNQGVIKHSDFNLVSATEWKTFKITDYQLAQECSAVRLFADVQENGVLEIAEIKPLPLKKVSLLPKLTIQADSGTISQHWVSAPFEYNNNQQNITGYIQYAMQGDSSRSYPKKNLKIKLYEDAECKKKLKIRLKADWDKNFKYQVKANWIDATHSRNLVDAQLVKRATANTPIANMDVLKALTKTQSLGQMEGFPIELSFNDGYYGLMTFNTSINDKSIGMDNSNPAHECVTTENSTQGFVHGQTFDSSNFGTKIHDEPSPDLKSNLTNFINFINDSSDDNFKAQLGNYIDIYSVINTYLFGLMSEEWDFQDKSQLLLTWNSGKYFYMAPYDLDSTWGLYWDGSHLNNSEEEAYFAFNNDAKFVNMISANNLMARMFKLFKSEIKMQYQKLRNNIWRNDQIVGAFKQFIDNIPEEAYEREQNRWPDIPSKEITDFTQIQQSVIERGNAMDQFMDNLAPTVDPLKNVQNQINQLKNGAKK